jgi:uncharacterized protein YqjF (DUF2071 family)
MKQRWLDLLFAHWRVPAESLRRVVPPQIPIDEFDGSAWVGVTPFKVERLRARATPPVPGVSSFLETNVRTYTTINGEPGIWFFSLDAENRSAVLAARRFYRLPYFLAAMSAAPSDGDRISYATERVSDDGPSAALDIDYRPAGPVEQAEPGTLDHFLTERYCLYALDGEGRVMRGDIDHPPWPLQPAEAELRRNTMGDQIGVELSGEPLLHFAALQDVVFWPLKPADQPKPG